MVLDGHECLYNTNHRELHILTLMGFFGYTMYMYMQEANLELCVEHIYEVTPTKVILRAHESREENSAKTN